MTFLQGSRGQLFYKYVVIFVTLVSGTLLTSGLVESISRTRKPARP